MPRAKSRSVTTASVEGSPLSVEDKARLEYLLRQRHLPGEAASNFVWSINSAIVFAYKLQPAMATPRERAAWFRHVRAAMKNLQRALTPDQRHGLDEVESEDLSELDAALCRFLRAKSEKGYPLDYVLNHLVTYCHSKESALSRIKPTKKPKGQRQTLADELASLWRQHFRKRPTATITDSRRGTRCSPFIEVLRSAIQAAESRMLPDSTLKAMATRALDELSRRDRMVRRYQRK